MKFEEYLSRKAESYYNMGICPIIHKLEEKKVKNGTTKIPKFLPQGHQNIGYDSILDENRPTGKYKSAKEVIYSKERRNNCNALSLLTGYRGNKDKSFIVLDIDVPKQSEGELINGLEWIQQYDFFTVEAKTANGGIHYFFKYDKDLCENSTKLLLKDKNGSFKKSTIDIRGDGGMVYTAPTRYKDIITGKYKKYIWINSILEYEMCEIPAELKKEILDGKQYIIKKEKNNGKKTIIPAENTEKNIQPDEKTTYDKQLTSTKKLVSVLSPQRATDTDKWLQICGYLSRYGDEGFVIFNNFSSRTLTEEHYSEQQCKSTFYSMKKSIPNFQAFIKWVSDDIIIYEGKDKKELLSLLKKCKKSLYKMKFGKNISYNEIYKIYYTFGFDNNEGVNTLITYLNHYLCALVNTSNPIYYVFSYNKKGNIAEMIFKKNFSNLVRSYPEFIFGSLKTKQNVFDIWNNNQKRRKVLNIVFDPSLSCKNKYLNTFVGWPYPLFDNSTEIDKSKFKNICKHIKDIICNNDKTLCEYWWKYHAHIFQKPEKKTGVYMLYTGEQGIGKGIICEIVLGNKLFGGHKNKFSENAVGNYYNYITSKEEIIAKFNSKMVGKLYTVMDEVDTFSKDYKFASIMKTRITSNYIKLEKKGIDALDICDYNNISILSNDADIIPIEASDRRYCCFAVNNKWAVTANSTTQFKQEKKIYFDNIIREAEDFDCMTHLFNYLMRIDLSDFNIKDVPISEYKKDLMIKNANPKLQFCAEKLVLYKDNNISNTTLFNRYKDWYKDIFRKEDTYTTAYNLGSFICKTFPFMVPRNKNGKVKTIRINGKATRGKLLNEKIQERMKDILSSKYGFEFIIKK